MAQGWQTFLMARSQIVYKFCILRCLVCIVVSFVCVVVVVLCVLLSSYVYLVYCVCVLHLCFSLKHGHHSNPTTPNIPNTERTENKTTDVVIQQHSRKLQTMDVLMSETC